MIKGINQSKLLIYLLIGGLIPIIFVIFNYMSQRSSIYQLQEMIETVQLQALTKEKKQGINLAVKEHYQNSDHFYIDKYIETIPLLENEIESLKKILNQQHLVENEAAKKRLDQLLTENQISFTEGVVQTYPYFHETTETLNRPVEVNVDDLQVILSRIDGDEMRDRVTPPQLIITDFKIDKKKTGDKNEVFQLNMKLLKREFF